MQSKQQSPLFSGRVEFIVHVANVKRPAEPTISFRMFIEVSGRTALDIKTHAHSQLDEQLHCAGITAEYVSICNVDYCVVWLHPGTPPELVPISEVHATEVSRMIAITTRTYLPRNPEEQSEIYGSQGQ